MKQIRIMIIDPRQLTREGLEKLLCRPLFDVVTTGRTLADAFNSADMAHADASSSAIPRGQRWKHR